MKQNAFLITFPFSFHNFPNLVLDRCRHNVGELLVNRISICGIVKCLQITTPQPPIHVCLH